MLQALVLIGLLVAVVLLWRRLDDLETRLATIEGNVGWRESELPAREALVTPPPLRPRPTRQRPVAYERPALQTPLAPAALHESVASTPELEPESEGEPAPQIRISFEDLFGRRLPIWGGGITLAVAGVLIVRLSIEAGLFPPIVRVLGGLLFGLLLTIGAEIAHRQTERVRDPRVAQALAGAGLATLYASILIAANLYHLVWPIIAFLGLAGVTAAAMGLALRFGAPSALLGLVGGLAAPALAGSGPANVPLLAVYLTLVVGGLFTVSQRRRWIWLGIGALAGGLGWGGLLIAGGALDTVATVSTGLYLLLIGFAFPALAAVGTQARIIRVAGGLFAALEVAALVATGGFALLNWGLFGLISIGIVWLARIDWQLSALPLLGMAVALALLASWPHPAASAFSAVLAGMILIYGTPAFLRLWKSEGSIVEAGTIAALGLAGLVLPLLHYHDINRAHDLPFAGLALGSAAMPALAALPGWALPARREDARFATLATTAAVLVAAAAILALPLWSIPALVAAIGLGTLLFGKIAGDRRLEASAWTMGGVAVALLALDPAILHELARACGQDDAIPAAGVGALRWAGLAVALAGYAWKAERPGAAEGAQAMAVAAGYAAIAQIVPALWLPLVPAAGIVAFALWSRTTEGEHLTPAILTSAGLALAWAIWPLGDWALAAITSLAGRPMLLPGLPNLQDTMVRLLVPGAALLGALALRRKGTVPWPACAVVALPAVAALHILYKHVFGLDTQALFVRHGLAERIVWELLMLAAAATTWQLGRRIEGARAVAIGLAAAALAHGGLYSMLLHNPLWAVQLVGSLPVLNGLLPAYAVPLTLLWAIGRAFPDAGPRVQQARSIARMLLILLFAASELRQLVHGSLLTVRGVTGSEDVLRSVGAIGIAIGFLLWGIHRMDRTWRMGSLVLMLAAVCKVFLIDAAGLDGLLRIASFVALGFSLIGIGWLYSRYLKADPVLTTRQ